MIGTPMSQTCHRDLLVVHRLFGIVKTDCYDRRPKNTSSSRFTSRWLTRRSICPPTATGDRKSAESVPDRSIRHLPSRSGGADYERLIGERNKLTVTACGAEDRRPLPPCRQGSALYIYGRLDASGPESPPVFPKLMATAVRLGGRITRSLGGDRAPRVTLSLRRESSHASRYVLCRCRHRDGRGRLAVVPDVVLHCASCRASRQGRRRRRWHAAGDWPGGAVLLRRRLLPARRRRRG